MMMMLHASLKFCWCKGCVCIISCHINDDDVACFFKIVLVQRMCVSYAAIYMMMMTLHASLKFCWCKGCVYRMLPCFCRSMLAVCGLGFLLRLFFVRNKFLERLCHSGRFAFACTHTHARTQTYTHTHTHTHIYTHTHTDTHTHTQTHTHTRKHTHMHTHRRIRMYTHT